MSKPVRQMHRKLLPEPRPINRDGIELSPALMRKVRRGLAQVARGEELSFKNSEEAMRYIFGPKV